MEATLEGKMILIADDDRDTLTTLVKLLHKTGASVKTAGDGDAAVERIQEFDPDLILLNASLPKRSGFLVLEGLRGSGNKPGEKPFVIMMTHIEGKRHKTWAESLGIDGYFQKPLRLDRLLKLTEDLLTG